MKFAINLTRVIYYKYVVIHNENNFYIPFSSNMQYFKRNNIGHPSLENNFKHEPVQTIKIKT